MKNLGSVVSPHLCRRGAGVWSVAMLGVSSRVSATGGCMVGLCSRTALCLVVMVVTGWVGCR